MSNGILTLTSYGEPMKQDFGSFLFENKDTFRYQLMELLREEINDPNSEFICIIKQALNTIADNEIEKVLKE